MISLYRAPGLRLLLPSLHSGLDSVPCDLLQPMKSEWKPHFQLRVSKSLCARARALLFPVAMTNTVSLISEVVHMKPSSPDPCHTCLPETNLWEGKIIKLTSFSSWGQQQANCYRCKIQLILLSATSPFPFLSTECCLETVTSPLKPQCLPPVTMWQW